MNNANGLRLHFEMQPFTHLMHFANRISLEMFAFPIKFQFFVLLCYAKTAHSIPLHYPSHWNIYQYRFNLHIKPKPVPYKRRGNWFRCCIFVLSQNVSVYWIFVVYLFKERKQTSNSIRYININVMLCVGSNVYRTTW